MCPAIPPTWKSAGREEGPQHLLAGATWLQNRAGGSCTSRAVTGRPGGQCVAHPRLFFPNHRAQRCRTGKQKIYCPHHERLVTQPAGNTQSGRVPGDSCCRPCPGPVRPSPEPGSRIAVALHTTPQHHVCKPTFTRILSLERHLKAQTRNKKINKQNSIPFVDLAINTNNNYILISAICNFPAFRRRGISWTLRTPPEHPRNGRALPRRAGLSSHRPPQARAASLSQQPNDSPHTAGSGGAGVR